jgi:hypothetical protein
MKKVLIIEDKAKSIIFKNRKVRTPVELIVSDSELKALKVKMKMADIQNWKVGVIKKEEKSEIIDYDYEEPKEVIVEELETEPKTTLEKLMKTGEGE